MIAHTSPILSSIPGVLHGFFGTQGGVSEGPFATLNGDFSRGDSVENVLENRRRAMAFLGHTATPLLTLSQVHGTDVKTVTSSWLPENAPPADGMVTRVQNLALGLVTADCGPVLLADPQKGVIGACHAGWRGALGGILKKTVNAMEALGSHRTEIVAAIGPMIMQESYEVDRLFYEDFLRKDKRHGVFFQMSKKQNHFLFDLPGFIEKELHLLCLKNIHLLRQNTFQSHFFSRRKMLWNKQSNHGCNLSIVMLSF